MSTDVFIGYKDKDNWDHGFGGTLKDEEYKLLKKISNKFDSVDALSIDELKALSDSKDLLVKAQLKLYDIEKGISKARKHKIVNVKKNLGGDNRIL